MKNSKRDMIRRAAALGSVSSFIAVLLLIIVYSKLTLDIGVVCPFKEIFNIECPGCGGTRMAISLLHLDFYQAFRYNPFILSTLPILAYVYCKQAYLYIRYNILIEWLDKFLVIYAILLLLFGIVRNIDMFSWLAPTKLT
ncbi:MAG: DUF2752 domain-containing protein [Lachnospiraceae bacterium]|nr:DUF2752 domain-containing protein [Lachnospiraceae bacterium]